MKSYTPLADYIRQYAGSRNIRAHMPGHKGSGPFGFEKYDITEISEELYLYGDEGIVHESELRAGELFRTGRTFYSAEGSSLAVKAMVTAAFLRARACGLVKKGERATVLAARNIHSSFQDVCAMLDLDVCFIYPEKGIPADLCESGIEAADVEEAFRKNSDKNIFAVYITSPDYLGNMADIKKIAEVCERVSLPLLVDNAHGAYLAFTNPDLHPVHLGAAMTADSAHKTLPVITGGAYLHVSEKYKDQYEKYIPEALQMYASTSPSFLISMSLDECNAFLKEKGREKIEECIENIRVLKEKLAEKGVCVRESEPMKLVVNAPESTGGRLTGSEMLSLLWEKHNVVCEYGDREFLVMMLTCSNKHSDYDVIYHAFCDILEEVKCFGRSKSCGSNTCRPGRDSLIKSPEPVQAVSIREAYFSDFEYVDVKKSAGRICARCHVSCPPAVPPVISGERISREQAEVLADLGIEKIKVIR